MKIFIFIVFMQVLPQDSLKTVFQNLNLKFTLYACAVMPIKFFVIKTQESSYFAPRALAPCTQLFVICAKLWEQLCFTLYAVCPAFMKSTPVVDFIKSWAHSVKGRAHPNLGENVMS
jgi:hypothetical protein